MEDDREKERLMMLEKETFDKEVERKAREALQDEAFNPANFPMQFGDIRPEDGQGPRPPPLLNLPMRSATFVDPIMPVMNLGHQIEPPDKLNTLDPYKISTLLENYPRYLANVAAVNASKRCTFTPEPLRTRVSDEILWAVSIDLDEGGKQLENLTDEQVKSYLTEIQGVRDPGDFTKECVEARYKKCPWNMKDHVLQRINALGFWVHHDSEQHGDPAFWTLPEHLKWRFGLICDVIRRNGQPELAKHIKNAVMHDKETMKALNDWKLMKTIMEYEAQQCEKYLPTFTDKDGSHYEKKRLFHQDGAGAGASGAKADSSSGGRGYGSGRSSGPTPGRGRGRGRGDDWKGKRGLPEQEGAMSGDRPAPDIRWYRNHPPPPDMACLHCRRLL